MANVAQKIIKENGFDEVITVVPKSSLDLCVPQGFYYFFMYTYIFYAITCIIPSL